MLCNQWFKLHFGNSSGGGTDEGGGFTGTPLRDGLGNNLIKVSLEPTGILIRLDMDEFKYDSLHLFLFLPSCTHGPNKKLFKLEA